MCECQLSWASNSKFWLQLFVFFGMNWTFPRIIIHHMIKTMPGEKLRETIRCSVPQNAIFCHFFIFFNTLTIWFAWCKRNPITGYRYRVVRKSSGWQKDVKIHFLNIFARNWMKINVFFLNVRPKKSENSWFLKYWSRNFLE